MGKNNSKNAMISQENIEYFQKALKQLQSYITTLNNQLISVNYIDSKGNVSKINFDKNVTSIGKYFKFTYNKNEISSNDALKKYKSVIVNYFNLKYQLYTNLISFLNKVDVKNYYKILNNVNEMVEGVPVLKYSKYKSELKDSVIYIKKKLNQILTQIQTLLNTTIALDEIKNYTNINKQLSDELTSLSDKICYYDHELKYFIWECEGYTCHYIKGSGISYKGGLPKINANIMETIKTYDYSC